MKYFVASILYAAVAGKLLTDGKILFGKIDFTTTTTTTTTTIQRQENADQDDHGVPSFLVDQPVRTVTYL